MPPFLLPTLPLPALTLPLPHAPAPRRHRAFAAPPAAAAAHSCRRRVCAAHRPPPRQPYRRRPAPAPAQAPGPRPLPSNAPPAPPQQSGPPGQVELEAAIYDFMRRSDKPGAFPTRAELLAAGRADLAAAVESSGGWLSLGWSWSSDDGDALRPAASSAGPGAHPDYPPEAGPSGRPPNAALDSVREQQEPTPSGRQPETAEAGSGTGLEGMLTRLRRERERARPPPHSKNQAGGQGQNGALMNHNGAPGRSPTDGIYTRRVPDNGSIRSSHSQNHILEDNKPSTSAKDAWRTWSLDNSRFSDFQAAEIHPRSRELPKHVDLDTVLMQDDVPGPSNGVAINDYPSDHVDSGRDEIHARLQNLELDLTDALKTLRSRFDGVSLDMSNGEAADVVNGLSDDWEFEETKVMHAQEELRSIRAKIAVLEGKMALEIIEKNRVIEEKQTRLDEVEKALSELRTVYVVWSNPASEVLLTGSFDGWTSQRRMEKSERGIFSLNLRLYPGRYEIKFIVDGVWKNDPLRPTVNNHGNENNLMIVT